jgi:hypothetical protein
MGSRHCLNCRFLFHVDVRCKVRSLNHGMTLSYENGDADKTCPSWQPYNGRSFRCTKCNRVMSVSQRVSYEGQFKYVCRGCLHNPISTATSQTVVVEEKTFKDDIALPRIDATAEVTAHGNPVRKDPMDTTREHTYHRV